MEDQVVTVANIPEDAQFVSDSHDVAAVLEVLGLNDNPDYDYGSLFVVVGDGDYEAVWGLFGIMPHLNTKVDVLL